MAELFEALAQAPARELEERLRGGGMPNLDALVGGEYRGYNITPVAGLLGIRTFLKGFFRIAAGVEGYNLRVVQQGLQGPWTPRTGAERFGFFLVRPAVGEPGARYPNAALLDYGGSPRNPRLRIERLLHDYLVVPEPTQPDVLLGKAYFAVGPVLLPSNFFLLQRVAH